MLGPGAGRTEALGGGCLRQGLVSAYFLSDWVGWGSWGCRRCSCRASGGPSGSSSRKQSRAAEGSCSRCTGSWQVRPGAGGSWEGHGVGAFPHNPLLPPGLRARMASLRQGCGDLRGLVSTFTQSCQGSLSEARGQVRTTCPSPVCAPGQPVGVLSLGSPSFLLPSPREPPALMGCRFWNQDSSCDPGVTSLLGLIFVLC